MGPLFISLQMVHLQDIEIQNLDQFNKESNC